MNEDNVIEDDYQEEDQTSSNDNSNYRRSHPYPYQPAKEPTSVIQRNIAPIEYIASASSILPKRGPVIQYNYDTIQ